MATQETSPSANIKEAFARPAERASPDIRLVSHSNVFYWWPAWLVGFAVALVTLLGKTLRSDQIPSSAFTLAIITAFSLSPCWCCSSLHQLEAARHLLHRHLVTAAFFVVLFAWLGWWDNILHFIPQLSARANVGFYVVFSTTLLAVWLLAFFVLDRLTIWRVRPGQMIEDHLIGGQAQSYDASGLVFERRGQNLFHDIILGFGAGDLTLKINGNHEKTIQIPNVLFVDRKVKAI